MAPNEYVLGFIGSASVKASVAHPLIQELIDSYRRLNKNAGVRIILAVEPWTDTLDDLANWALEHNYFLELMGHSRTLDGGTFEKYRKHANFRQVNPESSLPRQFVATLATYREPRLVVVGDPNVDDNLYLAIRAGVERSLQMRSLLDSMDTIELADPNAEKEHEQEGTAHVVGGMDEEGFYDHELSAEREAEVADQPVDVLSGLDDPDEAELAAVEASVDRGDDIIDVTVVDDVTELDENEEEETGELEPEESEGPLVEETTEPAVQVTPPPTPAPEPEEPAEVAEPEPESTPVLAPEPEVAPEPPLAPEETSPEEEPGPIAEPEKEEMTPVATKHTEAQLNKIADQAGMAGLYEIGEPYGVVPGKGKRRNTVIAAILEAQGNSRATAKKAPAKKRATAKRAPAKKTAAKRAPAKKTTVRKAPAKKAPAKRATTKRAPAKKVPAAKRAARESNRVPAGTPLSPAPTATTNGRVPKNVVRQLISTTRKTLELLEELV